MKSPQKTEQEAKRLRETEGEGREKGGGEANHKRLLTIENKLRVARGEVGGGWAKLMMDIKEGTCNWHHVLYVSDESLNSTPETSIILYVNQNLNKNVE